MELELSLDRRALLGAALFAAAGPAAAQTADFTRSERLTVHSPALGEDVVLRLRYPALALHPDCVVLLALTPEPHAQRIAAELRKRELETSMFGVTVVSLEAAGPVSSDELAETLGGPTDQRAPARFTRFLGELHALLTEELKLGEKALVAGTSGFGRLVLQASIEDVGRYEEYAIFEPELSPEQGAVLGKRVAPGLTERASNINLMAPAWAPGEPRTLETLIETMTEGSFYIDYQNPPEDLTAVSFFRDRAAQMAVVPPP